MPISTLTELAPAHKLARVTKLPSISGERTVRALKRAGFIELRQKGSHVSLEKRAGLSVDEFKDLL